jgi:hypothetical protein
MRKRMPLPLLVSFLVVLVAPVRADETTAYRIAGDYVEGCACRLICPCDLSEDAAAMKGCQATFVWHIEQGRYGDVALDGLTLIGVILKPETNVNAAVGTMEWGLYLDEHADAKQRAALEAFAKKAVDADGLADELPGRDPGHAVARAGGPGGAGLHGRAGPAPAPRTRPSSTCPHG